MTDETPTAAAAASNNVVDPLLEAQAFLDNMNNDDDIDLNLNDFAIDSDDDDDDEARARTSNTTTNETEALLRVPETTTTTTASTTTQNGDTNLTHSGRSLTDLHPLSEESLQSSSDATPSASQPTTSTPTATPTPTTSNIQERAMTFASQMANFAQRAATQIENMSDKVVEATSNNPNPVAVPPVPQQIQQQQQQQPVVELDNDVKHKLLETHVGPLLPGERVIMFLSNLLHVSDASVKQLPATTANNSSSGGMWCCAMTYYRVLLFHTSCSQTLIQVPLASMDKVEKSVYTTSQPMTLMGLVLYGKDNGRQVRFTTPSYGDTLRAHEALLTYAFPGRRNLGYLFAFESKRHDVMASLKEDNNGHKTMTLPPTRKRFVPQKEFTRQGILDETSPWILWTSMNAQYQLCMSYPSVLVGPANMPEGSIETVRTIRQCAAFRSEQRLPCLTWGASDHGGSLWRASQPKVGLQGNRSTADEAYLQRIAETAATVNASQTTTTSRNWTDREIVERVGSTAPEWTTPDALLKILDLRPKASAMANRTGGYGYENTSYYTCASIKFCNIGNIHAVRDAYTKISALCLGFKDADDTQWLQAVEDTRWLTQIRLLLSASWQTAFWIHVHHLPVLLHCSHGWDRTSQVAACAQILLDPYYRTMEGFVTLVEKDFLSFGHPFHKRCAHGEGRNGNDKSGTSATAAAAAALNDEGQISPIFIQFLDAVYQMVHQYPEQFEFNTRFLLLISEHVYSCRFGTMLCDTEREREVVAGIRQRTHCLWDYLEERSSELKSVMYNAETSGKSVLWMPLPTLLRNVTLWCDRHGMYAPNPMHTSSIAHVTAASAYRNDQQSSLVTAEDYYDQEIIKSREEVENWKRIAQERLDELNAWKQNSKGGGNTEDDRAAEKDSGSADK